MVRKKSIEDIFPTSKDTVPDGGWGWIILLSSFFVMFMLDGLFASYGLFLPVLMERLNSSPSSTSLAGSMIVGSLLFIAILACPLIEKFGIRIVSICGAIIACSGLVLSSMVKSIWIFFLTYGIITGSGLGLMYLSSIVIVNQYFDKKRGIAQSIMSAGSGLGVVVLSPVTEYLLESYDWRGALLIFGGFFLQLCVACAMFRPQKSTKATNAIQRKPPLCEQNTIDIEIVVENVANTKNKIDSEAYLENTSRTSSNGKPLFLIDRNVSSGISAVPRKSSTHSLPRNMFFRNSFTEISVSQYSSYNCVRKKSRSSFYENDFRSQKDIFYCGSTKRLHQDPCISGMKSSNDENIHEYLLVSAGSQNEYNDSFSDETNSGGNLLFNKLFLVIAIGAFLTQMVQFIPTMFLGDIGLTAGLTSKDVSWIFSMFGIVNTIGRLLPGILVDKTNVSATTLCCVGMVGCAVTCFLFPLCNDFPTLMSFAVVFALFVAFPMPLQPIMVFDSIGIDNLTKGISIITVIKGPAAISRPPLAGALYESTKDYNITIIFAGCLCLATAFIYMILPIFYILKSSCCPSNDDIKTDEKR